MRECGEGRIESVEGVFEGRTGVFAQGRTFKSLVARVCHVHTHEHVHYIRVHSTLCQ